MKSNEGNYEQIIEKAAQLGYENELKYFGCSQAVVSALVESFGIGARISYKPLQPSLEVLLGGEMYVGRL